MNDIVINYLIKKNFIVEDEKEEYLYGIEVLELKILHTVGIIAISIINHRFIEMILFLTFYSYIRSIIGGFHAKTRVACFVISIMMAAFTCYLLNNFYFDLSLASFGICILAYLIIRISDYNKKLIITNFIIMFFLTISLIFELKSIPMTLLLSMSFPILFKLIDSIYVNYHN